jgi:hypothetical protein
MEEKNFSFLSIDFKLLYGMIYDMNEIATKILEDADIILKTSDWIGNQIDALKKKVDKTKLDGTFDREKTLQELKLWVGKIRNSAKDLVIITDRYNDYVKKQGFNELVINIDGEEYLQNFDFTDLFE